MHESPFWRTPVLRSVIPVVEASRHVRTDPEEVERVAGWLAYEPLGWPEPAAGLDAPMDPDATTDLILLTSSLNFAFTDFQTGVKFVADRAGRRWSDSDGMVACLLDAIDAGVPVLDGDWMARVTGADLERVFSGTVRMPMLAERARILNDVGTVLVDRHGGRWSRWLRSCAPAMYAGGDGLLERLSAEFPRFLDVSDFHGREVRIFKLAQLALWQLHAAHRPIGDFAVADLSDMTAFADYIVPVALRLMGILAYDDELEARIAGGEEVVRDSDEEVEIRAHTLYATALLTEAVNRRRPADDQVVIPRIDYRLWKTYHATSWPHHLTRTTMY
jgi:hypothetical protein